MVKLLLNNYKTKDKSKKKFKMSFMEKCNCCNGTGHLQEDSNCSSCNGKGII